MTLDLSKVGARTEVFHCEYDWKTLVLYALGIGATTRELDYLYEKRGPKVYPSFAMVPNYPVLTAMLDLAGAPLEKVLHSGQTVRVLGELPASGTLTTVGTLKAMYDMKRMSQLVFETRTEIEGVPVFETEWEIILRDIGGFGGPKRPKPNPPNPPKRDPDWSFEEHIPETQALLYRLSGDTNPLHADPDFAKEVGFDQGPILHGLCTFGYVCRAVVLNSCNGDASKLKSLTAQFKKPVWPGQNLCTLGYQEGNDVYLQAHAETADNVVVGACKAELKDS